MENICGISRATVKHPIYWLMSSLNSATINSLFMCLKFHERDRKKYISDTFFLPKTNKYHAVGQRLNYLNKLTNEQNSRRFQIHLNMRILIQISLNCVHKIKLTINQHWLKMRAWCHQATRLFLNHYRQRSLTPYGATRPQ